MHGTLTADVSRSTVPKTRLVLWIVVGAGALAMLVQRLWLAQDLPLWLDETWTAVIVSQPSWSLLWREIWLDCNAPLYYVLMWLWTDAAGVSNAALRAPSLIFMIGAAAVAWLWRPPGQPRDASLTWAALIFFWWQGVSISLDARAYALLLLISVAQTIAFARLLQSPSTRRAAVWAALASAAIFTHYYAIYVVAAQGAVYLWRCREDALRTWPAALAFVPSLGWLVYHFPRLADYARPDVAWYEPLGLGETGQLLSFVIGAYGLRLFAFAAIGLLLTFYLMRRSKPLAVDEVEDAAHHLWWTAASGLLALAFVLGVGLVKPSLTARYLTAIVPLVLLGMVLAVRRVNASGFGHVILVGVFLAASLAPQALKTRLAKRSSYGYESASAYLARAQPNRLVFAWDHPAAKILSEDSLRGIGGFFFSRNGTPLETVPVVLAPTEDANRRLVAEANGSRPAILWIYNVERKSAARVFPPRIASLPGWRCLHTRRGPTGVVACAPSTLFKAEHKQVSPQIL